MSIEDFINLCKTKIRLYIQDNECDVFNIWKDYWTLGSVQDSVKSFDNQRALFGVYKNDTLTYYDMTYSKEDNKIIMKVYTCTHTENISLTTQQGG